MPILPLLTFVFSFAQTPPPQDPAEKTVTVIGSLKEDELVGPYRQPEWTTKRWSPATRVYVHAMPGEAEFEQRLWQPLQQAYAAATTQLAAPGAGGRKTT